jgi:hypothetical protein
MQDTVHHQHAHWYGDSCGSASSPVCVHRQQFDIFSENSIKTTTALEVLST